ESGSGAGAGAARARLGTKGKALAALDPRGGGRYDQPPPERRTSSGRVHRDPLLALSRAPEHHGDPDRAGDRADRQGRGQLLGGGDGGRPAGGQEGGDPRRQHRRHPVGAGGGGQGGPQERRDVVGRRWTAPSGSSIWS